MIRYSTFLSLTLCSVAPAFQPAEPFKPGKLPPADVAALQQGLTLRFYAKADDKKPLDARRVRLAALHVPAGAAPSPFVSPGGFAAKLTGYIKNPLKGSYSFRLVGTGSIVLKINDKAVLKHPGGKDKEVEVELAKNYNRIEIDYVSPPKDDATLRLYWSGEKFGFEPVPPEVLSSRGDEKDLVDQAMLREGRQLFANRYCVNCHSSPPGFARGDRKMPELQSKAPDLDASGARFQLDWMTAWILNPRALRPEASMPTLLSGPQAEKQAADIAAYLAALKMDAGLTPLGKTPNAAEGETIFGKLGCITCHRLDDPKSADELARLSLHFVNAKFAPHAIEHFLKNPHQRYAWTRMPDFTLSNNEAGHLEAFLREKTKGKIEGKTKGDPARGAKLFDQVGCARCHDADPAFRPEPFDLVNIKVVDKGCLAAKDHGKAPDFGLTGAQRAALTAFVKTDGLSLTRETPAEFSLRQVQALQCASCHRRDGAITRWQAVLEDEGKEPEKLPSLTWTGEKLKPAWTKKMLAGAHDHRARPWIKARMPAFGTRAEMLAVGLSHEHGFGVHEDERPAHDPKLAAIGAKLIPQQGGFNCINCHGIGTTPPIAPFEAPGINLLDASVRLRYVYYQRWMLTPDRVDVTMRMPIFATDGRTTQLREVFDGDARRQFDALWHYVQTLPSR